MMPRTLLALALAGFGSVFTIASAHADGDFVLLDANRDGSLSRDEAGWQPLVTSQFDRLDRNHDGALSRAEFAAFELAVDRESRAPDAPARAARNKKPGK